MRLFLPLGLLVLLSLLPVGPARSQGAPVPLTQALLNNASGKTLVIKNGTYRGMLWLRRQKDVVLKAETAGKVIIQGGNPGGLEVRSSQRITIEGFVFTKAYRGLWVTDADVVTAQKCTFSNNTQQGFLTVRGSRHSFIDCLLFGTRGEHGGYISHSSDNNVVRNCTFRDNNGQGFQLNAVSASDAPVPNDPRRDCLSFNNVIEHNVSVRNGGSSYNLLGVRDSRIVDNLGSRNRLGMRFGANTVRGYGSKNNEIRGCVLSNADSYSFREGSVGNRLLDSMTIGPKPLMSGGDPQSSAQGSKSYPSISAAGAAVPAWMRPYL